MAEHNQIGKIGEQIAQTFLMKHGFSVLEVNYHTRYGEIDIIAKKDKKLRFVEVKSVKVQGLKFTETLRVRPEDNLTRAKWHKIRISVETYLRHRNVTHETPFQIDLACVYVDQAAKQGKVVLMENIHIE